MHLTHCQDQKSQTLEEFYGEMSNSENHVTRQCAKTMLALIERLRASPDQKTVYGLTSHLRLCLLSKDTYASPWFVIIATLDTHNYFIEYLMPDDIAPWPRAYVKGEAQSEDDAVRMTLIAVEKSGGWRTG